MALQPQDRDQSRIAVNATDSGLFATWSVSPSRVAYPDAVARMEARAEAIRQGRLPQHVWLLEHPPLYTAGTSAREGDLLTPDRFPVYRSGRGGQYTYHGPGQRVAYVMLDLQTRGCDLRAYIRNLEKWIIRALARFDIQAERRPGRVGIWVDRGRLGGPQGREEKIAAIGVRVRRWVTFHGIAVNVNPDLSHFEGIVPCGIRDHGVTSLAELGVDAGMNEVDAALRESFEEVFALATHDAPAD